MPKKTPEGKIPYEDIDQKEYHRQYYKKNKELIRAKRMMAKENIVTEDVKKWKEDKLNDPWAFYPFYDPSSNVRYGEEECSEGSTPPNTECLFTSMTDIPSSLSTSINSKDAL